MLSMVESSEETLVVRSLITGDTFYTIADDNDTFGQCEQRYDHLPVNATCLLSCDTAVNEFIYEIRQLKLQKNAEEERKQQQELQNLIEFVQQHHQQQLQLYVQEHNEYKKKYNDLLREREFLLLEQQQEYEQLEQQEQEQQQYEREQQQQKQIHEQQLQMEMQEKVLQERQQLERFFVAQQKAYYEQQNHRNHNNNNNINLQENHGQFFKELQHTFPDHMSFIKPQQQQQFLLIYNYFQEKFDKEKVLQQSAAEAGTAQPDELPQISYHLLYGMSQQLVEWLEKFKNNNQQFDARQLHAQQQLFTELKVHFKHQFLNMFKFYRRELICQQQQHKQQGSGETVQNLIAPVATTTAAAAAEAAAPTSARSEPIHKFLKDLRAIAEKQSIEQHALKQQAKEHQQYASNVDAEYGEQQQQQQQQQFQIEQQQQQEQFDMQQQQHVLRQMQQQRELYCLLQQQQTLNETVQKQQPKQQPEPTTATTPLIDINGDNLPECRIKRTYSCVNCRSVTQNPRHYLMHLRIVHGRSNTIYMCPICQYATSRCQKFVRHVKSIHRYADALTLAHSPGCKLSCQGVTTRRRRTKVQEH